MKTRRDPLIDEVRRVRLELSSEFDHDIRKMGAFLRKEEAKHSQRLKKPGTARKPRRRPALSS
jgi:hypothetical protein